MSWYLGLSDLLPRYVELFWNKQAANIPLLHCYCFKVCLDQQRQLYLINMKAQARENTEMGSKKSSRKLHFLRVIQCAPRVALCCELRCGSVGHIMWCFRCGHGWLGEKVENTGVSTADWVQRLYTRQLSGLYFIAESWMEPHLAYWVIQ